MDWLSECYVRGMRGSTPKDSPIVVLHTSDELCGADRILLDIYDAPSPDWRARGVLAPDPRVARHRPLILRPSRQIT